MMMMLKEHLEPYCEQLNYNVKLNPFSFPYTLLEMET